MGNAQDDSKDTRSDLYARMADFEWSRLDRLSNAITFQTGLAFASATPLALFAQNLPPLTCSISAGIFVACGAVATLAWLVEVWFLFLAWHGYGLAYLPTPEKLEEQYEGLLAHQRSPGVEEAEAAVKANARLAERLVVLYRRVAEHNRQQNKARSAYLHKSRSALALSLISLLPTFIAYMVASSTQTATATVKVTSPIDVRITAMQDNETPQPTPSPEPPADSGPAEPPAPPPEPPPLDPEIIREGDPGTGTTKLDR